MYEPIIKLIETVLSGLPKLDLSGRKRKKLAKIICSLHMELSQLIENGYEIIKLLDQSHITGHTYYALTESKLLDLLNEQKTLIISIKKKLQQSDIKSILALHIPQISRLPTGLSLKGALGISFLLESYRSGKEAVILDSEVSIISDKEFIKLRKKELAQIRGFTKELKAFILNNFELKDLF